MRRSTLEAAGFAGIRAVGAGYVADEPDVFRFEDNNGIVVELRVAGQHVGSRQLRWSLP